MTNPIRPNKHAPMKVAKISLISSLVLVAHVKSATTDTTTDATIDRITIADLGSSTAYSGSAGFRITPWRDRFFRSDGIVYPWGAGSTLIGAFRLISVTTVDDSIFFTFDSSSAEYLMKYTDFSFGDYGSTGTILPYQDLVLIAERGGTRASISGEALIGESGTGYSPPRGALYTAPVGSVIPFNVTYELIGDTWDESQFDTPFSYRSSGEFDFKNFRFVPEPKSAFLILIGISILGLRKGKCSLSDKPAQHL